MWFKKQKPVTQPVIDESTVSAAATAAPSSTPAASAKVEETVAVKKAPMAKRFLNKILGVFGTGIYYSVYLPIKAVTVSPTTKPVSMIWNSVANKNAVTKWATRLLIAVPAAVAIPAVVQPAIYRAAFVQATKNTYNCNVTGVETKVYPYSDLQEFAIFPAGYLSGFRDSWMNSALPVMTRPINGSVSKTLVFAMCAEKGSSEAPKAETFEVTDTWFRGDKKFRSNDIGTEMRALIGKPNTEIEAAGVRYGPQSWMKNVLAYKAG